MSGEQRPGTVRPRGRTERVRQTVLAAARTLLIDSGYDALTIERVAAVAGVAKSTVYRRWGNTDGLLLELLEELVVAELPLADTGSVDEDLRLLGLGLRSFFADQVVGAMVLALIAEGTHNPKVAAELGRFWGKRNDRACDAVRRGIDRGELPSCTDPVEVIRAVGAPLYYRLLVTREPVDEAVAERAAAAALVAARAGLLTA